MDDANLLAQKIFQVLHDNDYVFCKRIKNETYMIDSHEAKQAIICIKDAISQYSEEI